MLPYITFFLPCTLLASKAAIATTSLDCAKASQKVYPENSRQGNDTGRVFNPMNIHPM